MVVTPTAVPTLVPTIARREPSATSTTPDPPERTPSDGASCESLLDAQYAAASDHCLMGASGTFCNGGGAPLAEPVPDILSAPGAVVEATRIDRLHSPALLAAQGSGLVWLRPHQALRFDALLIGDLQITDKTAASDGNLKWRVFTLESGEPASDCDVAPPFGAIVLQSAYGQRANPNINGVATAINGTLVVLTQAETTKFIAIEGRVLLVVFGHRATLQVGQQLSLRYNNGDWTTPAQLPGSPQLLDLALIEHLPVTLFARPLPIPQPGYAQTQGGVNMRAAPAIDSRLLFQVPAGETMSALGISEDREWLHIRLGNGETGWMSAELLAGSLGEIETVYDLTPAPPQRYGVHARRATVKVPAGGNLREAPDTAFRVLRTLPVGMPLELLARSPYSPWVKVRAGEQTGWMALFTLETKSVISSLPIDYGVPLPPRATATPSFSYGGGHAYPDPEGGY